MKYTTVILALVASVFAVPQASITSAPAAAPIPSGLTPAVSCVLNCTAGDVMCQAACQGNARPNASQAIETNNCAAKCDQGTGSAADAIAFGRCVDGCIASLFPSSQTAFAPGAAVQASSVKAGASATSSGAAKPTGSATSQASGSSFAAASAAQSTGAADVNAVRLAGAGFAGLLAIFAI